MESSTGKLSDCVPDPEIVMLVALDNNGNAIEPLFEIVILFIEVSFGYEIEPVYEMEILSPIVANSGNENGTVLTAPIMPIFMKLVIEIKFGSEIEVKALVALLMLNEPTILVNWGIETDVNDMRGGSL